MPKPSLSAHIQRLLKENDGKVFSSEQIKSIFVLRVQTRLPECYLVKAGLIVSIGRNSWQVKFGAPRKVTIAFDAFWRPQMLSVQELFCTIRNYPRGRRHDTFEAFGKTWKIISVSRWKLSVANQLFHQLEGCSSPWEFRKLWNKFHPDRPYDAKQQVYVHLFIRDKEEQT